jgi:hypothetical protein
MIERLAKELCEKSGCHHKCKNTTDCVVEDEAKLMVSDKEKQIEEIKDFIDEHCDQGHWFLATLLYNAGYRKQSEGEWIENEDDFWVMCSECGTEFLDDQIGIVNTYSYCPDCGAKMKEIGGR